ncbi:MAG: prepilin-type N-terminal cleavage/methylation domain-containing protein [Vampirovibrio sp.]|jgi:prepilin-type N-terminal cleavage/methylation domain-containing protein|nr:prepilin-type N-terminal cleavage/methylation domain-containing protein [Vampirovibrio sp.]
MKKTTFFKGFTLVEVLISLGIVGILGALVVPSLLNNIEEQRLKAQAKGGYSTLLQALDLLSNDWEGELAADRLGVDPRANTDTAGVFANLSYRIKSVARSTTAAGSAALRPGITEPVALTNILVLPNNVMFMSITRGAAASTLNIDINGVNGPNIVGTDIFPIQFNYTPNPTVTPAGNTISAFDARISDTLTAAQIARWHTLTDTGV